MNSTIFRGVLTAFLAAAPLLPSVSPALRAQFASGVSAVEVYATVTDAKGEPVRGLTRDDFVVRENGEDQRISAFAAAEFPLAVGLAIDRSFSMSGNRLAVAKSGARVFLGELRPEDDSMLLAIGSRTEVIAPLSKDRTAQLAALSALDAFGTTGLYDALIAAIDEVQAGRGRRALLLLSDGADRYSRATAQEALERARRSDVMIYPVALGSERPEVFAELATLTGGRSFHLRDPKQLSETLRTIARELREQYLIGYTPARPIAAGEQGWRAIQVTVKRPNVRVRARDGYIVSPGGEALAPRARAAMYDVAVIGAGPAGAWTARALAAAGARVAIVDGSHPREKPCGGGVTARARALVAEHLQQGCSETPVDGAVFEGDGRQVRVPLPHSALTVVSRAAFDGALLACAQRAGAEHVAARVSDVRGGTAGWTIAAGQHRLQAAWLVGADGANSLVRRRLARPFPRAQLSIAAGHFVRGATDRDIHIQFLSVPRGYLWSFARADHLAVGACAQADETSSAQLIECSARWIARRAAAGGPLQRYSWPVPSLSESALRAERPAGPRWVLVGDAAGLVDPITREGIHFALRSAEYAAAAISGGRHSTYVSDVRRNLHAELIRATRLRRLFFQPAFVRLLIRALEDSPPIRAVMADLISGCQPYRGLRRRLIATGEWRLMMKGGRLLI